MTAPRHERPPPAFGPPAANVSIRDLRAFLLVAELKSFTKAAERIHLTQAGVSSLIRSMEQTLNCRLFERTTREVHLTLEGRRLYPFALRIVHDMQDFQAEVASLDRQRTRTLSIGATPLVCATFLPQLCYDFKKIQPDIQIDVTEIPFEGVPQAVENGQVEIGLSGDANHLGALSRHVIGSFSLVWLTRRREGVPPGPGGDRSTISWRQLSDGPLILLKPDDPFQLMVDRYLRAADQRMTGHISVGSVVTQISMVSAGIGDAIVPSIALPLDTSGFVIRRLVNPDVSMSFLGLTAEGVAPGPKLLQFLQIAKDRLPSLFAAA